VCFAVYFYVFYVYMGQVPEIKLMMMITQASFVRIESGWLLSVHTSVYERLLRVVRFEWNFVCSLTLCHVSYPRTRSWDRRC